MSDRPAARGGPVGPARSDRTVTTLQRVGEVFAGRGFRRFFVARAVSQFGDGIFQIAAADVLLFHGDPGDNPVVRLFVLSAVVLVPFSIISPFTGVFIDRWERRSILTRVPLLRAAVAALLPAAAALGTDSLAFYAVVLIVLSANRFFLATMSAVLPQLVPGDDLLVANSVSSTGGSVANVIGLGVGTALSAVLSGNRAGVFAALAFIVSAITARAVPVHRGLQPHRARILDEVREVFDQMIEGLTAVRRARRVAFGLSAIGVVQLLVGAVTGALFFAFIIDLRLGIGAATGLLGILAVSIAVGIVLVPVAARRIRHDLLVPIAFLIAAVGTFYATVGDVTRARLTVGTFFVGLAYAFAKIPVDTIVQEDMADELRGRAFAAYDMLFNIARVAGVGVVAIAYATGATTIGVVGGVGVGYLVAAAAFGIWERMLWAGTGTSPSGSGPAPARIDDAGREALLQPGELVGVRSYAGSRGDEEPRALVVGGYEIPIDAILWRAVVEEQGERARVFVVAIGDRRVRLAHRAGWEIERVDPLARTD